MVLGEHKRVFEQQGYRCIAATSPFHDMAPDDVPDPRLGTTSLLDYAAAVEPEIRRRGAIDTICALVPNQALEEGVACRGDR